MKLQSLQSLFKKFIVLAVLTTLAACASNKSSETDPDSADSAGNESSVQTQGVDEGDVSTVSNDSGDSASAAELGSGMSKAEQLELLQTRSFYFGFDSFRVSGEDKKAVVAHGKFLAETPVARVRVEGHTDERGTREYNLALGERRAKAVKQLLMGAGAQSRQIEVITFGEERPKASGSSESDYQQNRRVDIEYTVGQP